jgi:hypothetical protein
MVVDIERPSQMHNQTGILIAETVPLTRWAW